MKVPLAQDSAVARGEATEVDFFGRSVLLTRGEDDRVRAYMNVCLHLGGPLELSEDGQTFRCQWHQACFSAATGEATHAPAPRGSRLLRLPTRIEAGQVVYVYGE